ncbi:uncharacterized protein RJT20DRAFT_130107 [Scheffersomyces xylosifermentans]|uniref:uncharacterized protein n=1 Tax=Scheffersomyces xylosifermentans TaxID=1304137 RepID=UPI00315D7DFF
MFSRNPLVATPRRHGVESGKNQEFTPIGNRSKSARYTGTHTGVEPLQETTNRDHAIGSRSRPLFEPITEFPRGEKEDNGRGDPSFDYTMEGFDTINSFEVHNSPHQHGNYDNYNNYSKHNSNNGTNNNSNNGVSISQRVLTSELPKNFVNSGISSIKESEERIKELNSENYLLRLKLIDLQRLLSGTPEDQRELLSQNSKLRSEIAQAVEEIEELRRSNYELKSSSNKENGTTSDFSKDQRLAEYKMIIQEKGEEAMEFRQRSEELQNQVKALSETNKRQEDLIHELEQAEMEARHSKSIIEDINNDNFQKLQNDNRSLREDNASLEQQLQSLRQEHAEGNYNQEHLDHENKSLKETNAELERQLRNLRQEHADGSYNFESYVRQLEQAENASAQLKQDLDHLNAEMMKWKSKSEVLERELKNNENSRSASKNEVNEILEDLHKYQELLKDSEKTRQKRERQLEEANNRLLDIENQAHSSVSESQSLRSSIQSLKSEISSLESQLRQKSELEFDLKHQIKKYESQIESLQRKIDLLEQSAHQPQFHHSNAHVIELEERAKFYEQEYDVLRDKEQSTLIRATELESKLLSCNEQIVKLQHDNDTLNERLQRVTSEKYASDRDYIQQMEADRRHLEAENRRLVNDVSSLQQDLGRLQELLESEQRAKRSDTSSQYLESRLERLTAEKREIEQLSDNYYRKIQDLDEQCRRLRNDAEAKSSVISELESKSRSLSSALDEKGRLLDILQSRPVDSNYNRSNGNDELTGFLKARASNDESKIRKLESEIESLRRVNESEINQFKDKIRSLESQLTIQKELSRNHLESNGGPSAVQALLELQLQEATKLSEELSKSLSDSNTSKETALRKLESLEKTNAELVESLDSLQVDEKSYKLKNIKLESKVKDLTSELLKVTGHCKKLANKVEELIQDKVMSEKLGKLTIRNDDEISRLRSTNQHLQRKIENLNKKYVPYDSSDKITLLENELTYYKARLYDMNFRANDLQLMYTFSINSIRNSDKSMRDDIYKLSQCGIYPDYSSMKLEKLKRGKPLTFKVLANFVLASVRIRRRYEKTEKRKIKLAELKGEIELGKIKMLRD